MNIKEIPGHVGDGIIDKNESILHDIRGVNRQRAAGNYDNTLPIVKVDIPPSVVISCPMARDHLSQAKACTTCRHFKNIVQIAYNDEQRMRWDVKYSISCKFPVDRKCSSVCLSGV